MWFYVLTMAVKCYFEMQMKLWLRDVHENGVVYASSVKASPKGDVLWSHLGPGDVLLENHLDC